MAGLLVRVMWLQSYTAGKLTVTDRAAEQVRMWRENPKYIEVLPEEPFVVLSFQPLTLNSKICVLLLYWRFFEGSVPVQAVFTRRRE
jgi:hypothetical protein